MYRHRLRLISSDLTYQLSDKKESITAITNEFFHENKNVEFEVQAEEVFINCSSYTHDCFIEGIKALQENY